MVLSPSECVRRTSPVIFRGFTLIEVLIVLFIGVLVVGASLVSIRSVLGTSSRDLVLQLAGAIQTVYDRSVVSGKTCRMHFFASSESERKHYQTECASGFLAVDAQHSGLEERLRNGPIDQSLEAAKERIEQMELFMPNPKEKPRLLPAGIALRIWTKQRSDARKDQFLYFFPHGLMERAHIHVTEGSHEWTIVTRPLTGQAIVYDRNVEDRR